MKFLRYLPAILLFMLLTACHTQQSATRTRQTAQAESATTLAHIMQAQPHFTCAQAGKIRVTLSYAERKINANGSINILTDSAIVLSIQPLLGIELFRVELTPHTITIVDKMNRRYAQTDYQTLHAALGMPVNFHDIQSLCMAHLFLLGKNDTDILQAQPAISKNTEQHQLSFHDDYLHYTFTADAHNSLLTQTQLQSHNNALSTVRYLNYTAVNQVLFPHTIDISYNSDHISGACTITLLKVQFNDNVNIAPLNLERYTPVTLKTLLP
ncbi:MAG: DUF4292 domain-containing protein [Paludibacter sp.]|nr:DUF4292 domain-containing protein [Bacteroidales bacterium]MCM1069674.1 DUF4292 domain-containing protein [Prevotella sp.]MCM1354320.1 DUF4292 domain-containing protein [Bacteroides sp.]MCM1443141.1 DUF4292 domain-containing protein [Muribaculum sp.]MCM1482376.1 DUF4292 domain-containing protein [Paludibacter sp.]